MCSPSLLRSFDMEASNRDVRPSVERSVSLLYSCMLSVGSVLWLFFVSILLPYVVMELVADGSLLSHLQLRGPFSEELIAIHR